MPSVRREREGGIATLTSIRYLREMIVLTSRTADAQEGIQAFFEKRKPVWKGR